MKVAHAQVSVAATYGTGATTQHALEGVPELRAEDGVDDRVQGGVEVAEPQEQSYQVRREVVPAVDREKDGHYEKGQPTDHKSAGNNG